MRCCLSFSPILVPARSFIADPLSLPLVGRVASAKGASRVGVAAIFNRRSLTSKQRLPPPWYSASPRTVPPRKGEGRRNFFALLFILLVTDPALADLEICNRTSFVIDAAIGIEDKGAAATRGWFRVDPGQCRSVLRGDPSAEKFFAHARALPLYGQVQPLTSAQAQLCVGEGDFLVAGARRCADATHRLAPFAEMKPRKTENGQAVIVAEPSDYTPEQARFAAVQRLLLLAGYGAEPIDGVSGPRSDAALASFLRERNLSQDAANTPAFLDLLMDAVREGAGPGLLWCNDTKHTVMAALGVDDGSSQTSRGWWRVEPGACLRPDLPRKALRVFSFAEAVDANGAAIERKGRALSWGGSTNFCVRNSRFEISDHSDCGTRALTKQGFQPVELQQRSGATIRFREP